MPFKKKLSLLFTYSVAFSLAYAEQHITVIIPSYNNINCCIQNLDSVFKQNYSNYHVIYIDDCSTDGMGDVVQKYIDQHGVADKITFIRNTYNRKALANIFKAVHMCKDNDLCVILDGDDTYAHENVLAYIDNLFATNNIWMAYAQYINVPEDLAIAQNIPVMGYAKPTPDELIASGNFRISRTWCWSGLRMFYAGLFKQIKFEHLIYPKAEFKGKFFPTSYDGALMYPMLEMCGTHFAFIPEILLHRNIDTPLNDFKIYRHIQALCGAVMREFTPYQHLEKPYQENRPAAYADIIICSDKKRTNHSPNLLKGLNGGKIYKIRNSNLFSSQVLRKIKRICHKSQAPYILLIDEENIPLSLAKALYWLNNTNALYLQFNRALLDTALDISQQPVEHIEENIYAYCTRCHACITNNWQGLFRKEHLVEHLRSSSSLQDLNNKIIEELAQDNHTILCAI